MGELGPPGGPMKLDRKVYDAAGVIKMISTFNYLVFISDSENNTVFECTSAKRLYVDPEALSATYLWMFPITGREVLLRIHDGGPPGIVQFEMYKDDLPREAIVYYTNYENCAIIQADIHGEQCILWTNDKVEKAVPRDCVDYFVDSCGVIAPAHSRDLCPDY
uniref:Lipocalin n=1 Tax=Rhipicephalus appendiculatus TaxID=34631 RepID=A0A131YL81_RHIAP